VLAARRTWQIRRKRSQKRFHSLTLFFAHLVGRTMCEDVERVPRCRPPFCHDYSRHHLVLLLHIFFPVASQFFSNELRAAMRTVLGDSFLSRGRQVLGGWGPSTESCMLMVDTWRWSH